MANKKHINCDCLFCNSKYPECGSTDVEVNFKLGFSYSNNSENEIELNRDNDEIEMKCNKCDAWLDEGPYLDSLLYALERAIDPPSILGTKIDANGKINIERFRFTSEPISETDAKKE